jgi:VanZ family protein
MMFDWFRRKFVFLSRVAALLCVIGICTLSLIPGRDVPMNDVSDKYRHGFAYGVFAVLVGCSFLNLRWWTVPLAFAIVTSIGVGIEFVQPYFDRSFDLRDALANAIGATIGCAVLVAFAGVYLKLRRDERLPSFSRA